MPKPSDRPDRDPMAGEVERLLRQLGPKKKNPPASSSSHPGLDAVVDGAPPRPGRAASTSFGRSAPAHAPFPGRTTTRRTSPGLAPGGDGRGAGAKPSPPASVASLPTPLGVWARVLLGLLLTFGVTQWPYQVCGTSLAGYLLATATVAGSGLWAARASWRRRMGLPHVLAIGIIFAGAAFATVQLLPRLGYAPTTTEWRCTP